MTALLHRLSYAYKKRKLVPPERPTLKPSGPFSMTTRGSRSIKARTTRPL
jgi:hypothetical protein